MTELEIPVAEVTYRLQRGHVRLRRRVSAATALPRPSGSRGVADEGPNAKGDVHEGADPRGSPPQEPTTL